MAFRLFEMVLEGALQLRIGGGIDQIGQRLKYLVLSVVDVLKAMEKEVIKSRDVFAE